jgi:hypothetical protein
MGLRLFLLPNFPGATFIQGATFIPDSRVESSLGFTIHRLHNKHVQAFLDLGCQCGDTKKTWKKKPRKSRLLSSTKGEENRIEL